MSVKIAIIGAGLTELTAARELAGKVNVTLFEKSRGLGGRLATRYAEPYQFDHGAQYFTAKSEAFQQFLSPLVADGVVARWDARFAELERGKIIDQRQWSVDFPHYVGVPKMNAIGKVLAEGVNIKRGCRVEKMQRTANAWELFDDSGKGCGEYDWVICTAPAQQSAELLPESFAHYKRVMNTKLVGCYAVILGFTKPLNLPFDAASVKGADISWISVNSSKPGREETSTSLQVHATNAYAEAHMEDDIERVAAHLHCEISEIIGHDVIAAEHKAIHRWRYANIDKQQGDAALVDDEQQLIACGDWCIHGRVESAYLSGLAAVGALKEMLV